MSLIDKNTFGDSKAAVVLVDLLNGCGDPKVVRKVCRLFTMFSQTLGAIGRMEDARARGQLLNLWLEECRRRVEEDGTMSPKIRSYLLNIEKALNKRMARELEGKTMKTKKKTKPQTHRFEPCPYCESTEWPKLIRNRSGFSGEEQFTMECSNDRCGLRPRSAYGDSIEEAKENWNNHVWSIATRHRM